MDIKKFWANKNVIITGHTGFKGSWLTLFLTYLGANVIGISREKYNGIYKLSSVDKVLKKEYFIDISNNIKLPKKEIDKFNPDIIFHLAGQSLVSVGYEDPLDTINTNILGTYNVLDYFNKIDSVKSAVVSTTDKVYLNPAQTNNEFSELGGSDFYSATKASSEFIIKSFLFPSNRLILGEQLNKRIESISVEKSNFCENIWGDWKLYWNYESYNKTNWEENCKGNKGLPTNSEAIVLT